MKRIRKRDAPPQELVDYIRKNPVTSEAHTWESFRDNCQSGLKAVQKALYEDQRGLCAYCELELVPKFDFRVSHFHPKRAAGLEDDHSWELRWDNMHGACNGGTSNVYQHPERRVENNVEADKHCDVVIGNEILDDKILNPLKIPPFPRLFQYEEISTAVGESELRIEVDATSCAAARYLGEQGCMKRAQDTIDIMHLNSANLMKMRESTYEEIKKRINQRVNSGDDLGTAMKRVAEVAFSERETWPEFFTVWRWALRDKAEEVLGSVNYDG